MTSKFLWVRNFPKGTLWLADSHGTMCTLSTQSLIPRGFEKSRVSSWTAQSCFVHVGCLGYTWVSGTLIYDARYFANVWEVVLVSWLRNASILECGTVENIITNRKIEMQPKRMRRKIETSAPKTSDVGKYKKRMRRITEMSIRNTCDVGKIITPVIHVPQDTAQPDTSQYCHAPRRSSSTQCAPHGTTYRAYSRGACCIVSGSTTRVSHVYECCQQPCSVHWRLKCHCVARGAVQLFTTCSGAADCRKQLPHVTVSRLRCVPLRCSHWTLEDSFEENPLLDWLMLHRWLCCIQRLCVLWHRCIRGGKRQRYLSYTCLVRRLLLMFYVRQIYEESVPKGVHALYIGAGWNPGRAVHNQWSPRFTHSGSCIHPHRSIPKQLATPCCLRTLASPNVRLADPRGRWHLTQTQPLCGAYPSSTVNTSPALSC